MDNLTGQAQRHEHNWFVYNQFWEYCACGDRRQRDNGEVFLSHEHEIEALEARLSQVLEENERLNGLRVTEVAQALKDAGLLPDGFNELMRLANEGYKAALEAARLAEAKAVLADEVLGDDDHLGVAKESAGVWYEFCMYCPSIQREIDNYKPRPFPHDPDCPKARYDALTPAADAAEETT